MRNFSALFRLRLIGKSDFVKVDFFKFFANEIEIQCALLMSVTHLAVTRVLGKCVKIFPHLVFEFGNDLHRQPRVMFGTLESVAR